MDEFSVGCRYYNCGDLLFPPHPSLPSHLVYSGDKSRFTRSVVSGNGDELIGFLRNHSFRVRSRDRSLCAIFQPLDSEECYILALSNQFYD
jgi:hypothetical protein